MLSVGEKDTPTLIFSMTLCMSEISIYMGREHVGHVFLLKIIWGGYFSKPINMKRGNGILSFNSELIGYR